MSRAFPNIMVVGSLNIDYIARVARLPAPGETVAAPDLVRRFGGKGANQALAAARHGARVKMVGCVGADDDGRSYQRRLRGEGVDVREIRLTETSRTGTALIAVDTQGENTIIVAAGANGQLMAPLIRHRRAAISSADWLLLQFEIPMAAIVEAARIANHAGVPVALNPSPYNDGFPWGLCKVDTLITNAGEAEAIFSIRTSSLSGELQKWQRGLKERKIGRLIITRGAKPTLTVTPTEWFETPALPVKPVDTVGAGDAFAGVLVTELARGADLPTAVEYANCAGALATLKVGAQEGIPTRGSTAKARIRLRSLKKRG